MIFRQLLIVCMIYVFLVFQSTLADDFAFHGFRPWLPGIGLMVCVVLHDGAAGIVWAGLLGLGVDCLSGEKLGVNVVAATFVATALLLFRHNNRVTGVISISVCVFAGAIFWRTGVATAQSLLANRTLDGSRILHFAFGDAVYSFVLTFGALVLFRMMKNALNPQTDSPAISLTNRWSMLTR